MALSGRRTACRTGSGRCRLAQARRRGSRSQVWPGSPYPLGASWDGKGVNFALATAHATKVEVCLFDRDGKEKERIVLPEYRGETWHGYVPYTDRADYLAAMFANQVFCMAAEKLASYS